MKYRFVWIVQFCIEKYSFLASIRKAIVFRRFIYRFKFILPSKQFACQINYPTFWSSGPDL